MNFNHLLKAVALGTNLLACMAAPEDPTGEDDPSAPASEDGASQAAAEVRRRTHSCPLTCRSESGNQSCCCDVGQRCVSGVTFCKCEAATVTGASSAGGQRSPR